MKAEGRKGGRASMRRRQSAIIGLILTCFTGFLRGEIFAGFGPDEACGGTDIVVAESRGKISAIQEIVHGSNGTLVEQFIPVRNDWKITLLLYSSRWQDDEPLSKDRIVRRTAFLASSTKSAADLKKSFGIGDIVWSNEPKRLLDYFHANRTDFRECARK